MRTWPALTYKLVSEDRVDFKRDYPDDYKRVMAKYGLKDGELPPDDELQDFHIAVRCHIGFRLNLADRNSRVKGVHFGPILSLMTAVRRFVGH